MRYQPVDDYVTVTADLAEINAKADGSVIGYRLMVSGGGRFSPSITCFATTGYPISVSNPMFEKLTAEREKIKPGARIHGLDVEISFNSKRKQTDVLLCGLGKIDAKENVS